MFCSSCGAPLPSLPPVVCTRCRTQHWRNPKPSASALVTSRGKLLLIQRAHEPWKNYWDAPGGFCSEIEHPMETAKRECEEETGVQIRIVRFLGIWMDWYSQTPNTENTEATLNIFYIAEPINPHTIARSSSEVVDIRWFAPSELAVPLAFPSQLEPAIEEWIRLFHRDTITVQRRGESRRHEAT